MAIINAILPRTQSFWLVEEKVVAVKINLAEMLPWDKMVSQLILDSTTIQLL